MHVFQLVPRLRPMSCGIGDWAVALSDEWRQTRQWETRFIAADPAWVAGDDQMKSAASVITVRNGEALARIWRDQGSDKLLLHYSGYGYASRGAPVWLVQAVKRLRRSFPGIRVTTMFHELFASGPPTSSAFWLSPVQRWVAAQVARLSDAVVTNRQESGLWLERHAPKQHGRVRVLPVFSSLGEAEDAPPPSQRENHLVFFGYQASAWGADLGEIRRVLRVLHLDRVTILGRAADIPADVFGTTRVDRTGWLDANAVSAILRTARYGLLAYPPAYLGKSSILAAFMAHGVVPVLVGGDKPLSEGLERGKHLLATADVTERLDPARLDSISSAGLNWYRPHDRRNTAAAFAELWNATNQP